MTRDIPTLLSVGIANFNNRILLFYFPLSGEKQRTFQIAVSRDGFSFTNFKKWAEIVTSKGQQEEIKKCSDFRVSKVDNSYSKFSIFWHFVVFFYKA